MVVLTGKDTLIKKERFNELDGRTWERYSISVWDIIKTPEEQKSKHPAMFPIELCRRLIEIYTKKGDTVLDPFMGSGSTAVAARILDRKGIGVEINQKFVKIAEERLKQTKLEQTSHDVIVTIGSPQKIEPQPKPEIYCDDAINILNHVKPESIDLAITSPPYWNIHARKRTADYKKPRPYSVLQRDLGNIENYDEFMLELEKIFVEVHEALKPEKYCIIIVMDLRQGPRFIPFHISILEIMQRQGKFMLEDIIIWNRGMEYSNLRPLGYPYKFIVNKVHEYIMIFRKKPKVEEESVGEKIDS